MELPNQIQIPMETPNLWIVCLMLHNQLKGEKVYCSNFDEKIYILRFFFILWFFSDIRLTKMMLTIFLCFLVCFLPLMLVNVADDNVQFPFLHILASVLAWASAVVNPFIYAFKNRQYQQAFIKVIFSWKWYNTNMYYFQI